MVVAAALSSVIGGLASTRILTLVNEALASEHTSPSALPRFIGICLVSLVFTIASQALIIRLSASSLQNLRLAMSRQLLEAPYRQLEEIGPARLLPVLTSDVGSISAALTALPSVLTSVTVIIACLAYLGTLSVGLLLALVAYAAVGIAVCTLPTWSAANDMRTARRSQDRMFELYRGLTDGAKELRLHRGRRETLFEGLRRSTEVFRRHSVTGGTTFELSSALAQTLLLAGLGLLMFAAPRYAGVTAQVTSGFALTLLFMSTPVAYAFAMSRPLINAGIAYEKIRELGLSLVAEERKQIGPVAPEWGQLELTDVVGSYRGRRGVDESFEIGPLSLTFRAGEITFIVGGNGSGKSTLVKVLVGLYKPDSGHIAIGGVVVDDARRDWLRQHFSAVFADFYLFPELHGLASDDLDERARDYLELLQIAHKVRVADGELSTIALSQGQRKRLALLTAYLEDRPIYVFDEWAADQDPVFKDLFYTTLLPELKARGKCVIAVTHDDRYFEVADRVLRMENGKLIAP
jgi:putative ATP-binding cassette transporter